MSRSNSAKLLINIMLVVITTTKTYGLDSSWTKIYDNAFLSAVEVTPSSILVGEMNTMVWKYPYNGIYISNNLGQSWNKLGLQDKGITDIKYDEGKIYSTTYYHTETAAGLFISTDLGKNWNHIGPPYSASQVEIVDGNIILGTYAHGIFISEDGGQNWVQKTPEVFIKLIKIVENKIYAVSSNVTFESTDNGKTWSEKQAEELYKEVAYRGLNYKVKTDDIYENGEKTNLNYRATDVALVNTRSSFILSTVGYEGLFKYSIPKPQVEKEQFIRMPWEYKDENDLIDKITAYFDHEYPLLSNFYTKEPTETNSTTLNFLGIRESPPIMYYSSHDGTDFGLPYGTPVQAVSSGEARYFWCFACGNSIEIDHHNGYKTIYMHLQDDVSVPKTGTTAIKEGEVLGKVGMSGNTTGPHLHLTVKKDDVVVDPFGWQNLQISDPWETYENKNFKGSKSKYIWKYPLHSAEGFINSEDENVITLDNKSLSLEKSIGLLGLNIFMHSYMKPFEQKGLRYINNTSVIIEAVDLLGNEIKKFSTLAKISYKIPTELIKNNLRIYYYNSISLRWEPISTEVKDDEIFGYTDHFSQFALFEETEYSPQGFQNKLMVKNVNVSVGY